ncbi:MAG: alpha/beta hydrolase [Acidimicrobiia bacterium]|nr:alpha/beta hydrolase [Acidimicrobiia bacterium]
MEARTHRYEVNGITVVADHRGDPDRTAVVFLHGGGQTRHSWGGSARRLAERGWHTVTIDARGHGDSDWASDYGLRSLAEDVRAVIESLAVRPVLVGASMGGLTSIMLEGELAPGTAEGVVLVDIVPNWSQSGGERIRQFMAERMHDGFASLDEVADAVAAYNPHRPRPDDLEGLKKNLRQRDGRWYWHWDPAFISPAFGAEQQAPSEMTDHDELVRWTERIDVPMMLVRGRTSDVVSEQDAAEFLERHPHVDFVDVTGAGHMVAGDRNDVFTDAVVQFLDRLA